MIPFFLNLRNFSPIIQIFSYGLVFLFLIIHIFGKIIDNFVKKQFFLNSSSNFVFSYATFKYSINVGIKKDLFYTAVL